MPEKPADVKKEEKKIVDTKKLGETKKEEKKSGEGEKPTKEPAKPPSPPPEEKIDPETKEKIEKEKQVTSDSLANRLNCSKNTWKSPDSAWRFRLFLLRFCPRRSQVIRSSVTLPCGSDNLKKS